MRVQVRFRFNRRTGEVEEFLIDDYDATVSDAEHNRLHDRITHEVGQVIACHPKVAEIHRSDIIVSEEAEERDEVINEEQATVLRQQQKQS